MLKLTTFLRNEGITQGQFAAQLGVDQATVSKLCRGRLKPGLKMAFCIERLTAGRVLASSWLEAFCGEEDAA